MFKDYNCGKQGLLQHPKREDLASQISWSSAYLSLIPLAFNVMIQPAGNSTVLLRRYVRTYVRASPITSGLYSISLIGRFVYYLCKGYSPRHAAWFVMTSLDKRDVGPDAKSEPGGNLQALEKQHVLRWFIFLMTTGLQVVKLMAARGCGWTQVWAGIYVGSFLVAEVLLVLQKTPEPPPDWSTPGANNEHPESLTDFEVVGSLVGHAAEIGLALWIAERGASGLWLLVVPTEKMKEAAGQMYSYTSYVVSVITGRWVAEAALTFMSILRFFPRYFLGRHDLWEVPLGPMHPAVERTYAVISSGWISFPILAFWFIVDRIHTTRDEWHVVRGSTGAILLLSLSYLLYRFGRLLLRFRICREQLFLLDDSDPELSGTGSQTLAVVAWVYFVLVFGCSLCGYAFIYDPSTTYKPGWTENLG